MTHRLIAIVALLSACAGSGDSQRRLRTAVDAKHDALNRCYAKSLARNADTAGTMTVVMHVPTSGKVEKVTIGTRDLASKKLQTCVRTALMGVEIADVEDPMEVEYRLQFAPAVSSADKPRREE